MLEIKDCKCGGLALTDVDYGEHNEFVFMIGCKECGNNLNQMLSQPTFANIGDIMQVLIKEWNSLNTKPEWHETHDFSESPVICWVNNGESDKRSVIRVIYGYDETLGVFVEWDDMIKWQYATPVKANECLDYESE